MKAILMSIQSKWLAKILNGEKTVELRKRFPRDYRGWVYLYCTKGKPYLYKTTHRPMHTTDITNPFNFVWCIYSKNFETPDLCNGKVVARVWVDKVDTIIRRGMGYSVEGQDIAYTNRLANQSGLTFYDLQERFGNNNSKAIHFSRAEIFDKPKELSEFMFTNAKEEWTYYFNACEGLTPLPKETFIDLINRGRAPIYCYKTLSKAPQSWQYVYVEVEDDNNNQ